MIPKLQNAMHAVLLSSIIIWCVLKGASYSTLRHQLWDKEEDDTRHTANVLFHDGIRHNRHPRFNNNPSRSVIDRHRSHSPGSYSGRSRTSYQEEGGEGVDTVGQVVERRSPLPA